MSSDFCKNGTLNIKYLAPIGSKNVFAVTAGIFDGVHIGHRALIAEAKRQADALGIPVCVFTFDRGGSAKGNPPLLSTGAQTESLLRKSGADAVCYASFDELKNMSGRDFLQDVILSALGAKAFVCGNDYRFGKNREGDTGLLRSVLEENQCLCTVLDTVTDGGIPVSSTLIRRLIAEGNIESANRLLGRRYCFEAEVVHGDGVGTLIGSPTLNQKFPGSMQAPTQGVYAVECEIGDKVFYGVMNYGVKPTFGEGHPPVCETYLFGFDGKIYGMTVRTSLVAFIRGEQVFADAKSLSERIKADCDEAMRILGQKELEYEN